MRGLFRLVFGTVALCFSLLVVVGTLAFLKKILFGTHSRGHVAVVDISGVIFSSSSFLREVDGLLEDKSVKSIVVRINSPGGLVAPSQELYQTIRRADTKVPVLISMGSVAASGGYYAALGGRKIFANPGTLTASIGVIMEFANTQKLYQWAKIDRFTVKAGKFKDIGSPLRPMAPEEKALLTKMAEDIHHQFQATVRDRRKLPEEALIDVTDGRIMTGAQAFEKRLVDAVGPLEQVIAEAKKLGGLSEDAPVVYSEHEGGWIRKLIRGVAPFEMLSSFQQLLPSQPGWRVLWMAPLAE